MFQLSAKKVTLRDIRSILNFKRGTMFWWEIILIHLLPVGITGALAGVYVAGLGWNASADEITLLLVAAKVYEYMILASLSSFILHHVRSQLRASYGVPLGLLTAPFRLNTAGGLYMLSSQFSSGAWSLARDKGHSGDVTTKIFFFGIWILAIAAAPSTGILLLPRYGWWPIASPTASSVLTSPVLVSSTSMRSSQRIGFAPRSYDGEMTLFNATISELYPQTLNSSTMKGLCYRDKVHKTAEKQGSPADPLGDVFDCPGAGLSKIVSGLPEILTLDHITEYVSNFSIDGQDYTRQIHLGWQESSDRNDNAYEGAVTYATTPLDFISRHLHIYGRNSHWGQSHLELKTVSTAVEFELRWDAKNDFSPIVLGLRTRYRRWYQPVVATECAPLAAIEVSDEATVASEQRYVATFSVGLHAHNRIVIPAPTALPDGHLLWPPSGRASKHGLRSVDVAKYVAKADVFPNDISAAFIAWSGDSMSLCLLTAKWALSDVWLAQPFDNAAQSSISVDPSLAAHQTFNSKTSSDILVLSEDWLGVLDDKLTVSLTDDGTNTTTPFGLMRLEEACKVATNRNRCLSTAISLYIADALARIQYYIPAYSCDGWLPSLARPTNCRKIWSGAAADEPKKTIRLEMENMENFIGVSSTYYRLQHGYGVNSVTVSLAWITVGLHAVVVLAHIAGHVIKKKTYQQAGWEDIGELMACMLKAEVKGSSNSVYMRSTVDLEEDNGGQMWRVRTFLKSSEPHVMESGMSITHHSVTED